LRIGCAEALTTLILPAIVEQFLDASPDIRLHVIIVSPLLQFEELRKRSVKLLIAKSPTSLFEDDLLVESLHDEELAVIGGVSGPWAARRHIELPELLQEQWIMPPSDSALGSFAFMPAFVADFNAQVLSLRLSSPNLSKHQLSTSIIGLKDRSLSQLATHFLDCARDVANLWSTKKAVKCTSHKVRGGQGLFAASRAKPNPASTYSATPERNSEPGKQQK
jgi:hypothetical protein